MSHSAAKVRVGDRTLYADLSAPIAAGVVIDPAPDAPQPSAFGLPRAAATPFAGPGFVLDLDRGGPVNCAVVTLAPHGNGTHTESALHVDAAAPPVTGVAPLAPFVVALVSVAPTPLGETDEHYLGCASRSDLVVTAAMTRAAASTLLTECVEGIFLRCAAAEGLDRRVWSGQDPPYLTLDCAAWLASLPAAHLLIDLPSVDRERDDGELPNHRAWWGLPPRGAGGPPARRADRTITELAAVPASVPDGLYLCALHVAPLALDAAPSRPVLFALSPTPPP
ncbi:MAG: cyclase family protein [Myxococcales bacterium]|nr:cyclase family protein [Myxococcales bacterium]MCB9533233.1 cyclase family protein [Myxococcales bacterium]